MCVQSCFIECDWVLIVVQGPDVKSMQHRREINKKTRSADKKLIKSMKVAKKVFFQTNGICKQRLTFIG
jgi:hypothetical protein